MGAHNSHSQIERSGSDFFWHWDHGSHFTCLWLHGFSGLKQLCPLSYHSSNLFILSCRLFSLWFGASSRHQQYPTVVALESQLGIELLGYDSGMIFQGHFSCWKLPFECFLLNKGAEILSTLCCQRPFYLAVDVDDNPPFGFCDSDELDDVWCSILNAGSSITKKSAEK